MINGVGLSNDKYLYLLSIYDYEQQIDLVN